MKKQILTLIIGILLIGIIIAGGITIRDDKVKETNMASIGYEVNVENYDGYTFVFDPITTTALNVKEELTKRLNIIDGIGNYQANGCSTDQDCYNAGFLSEDINCSTTGHCRTVCYRNRCIDNDKTAQVDKELAGIDKQKETELDSALGVKK